MSTIIDGVKMNVIVCGSKGRMGSAIISLIAGYDNLSFIGGVDSSYIGDESTPL